ncbi:MAG: PA0069 family radical SAM protein [Verrucomicrobia bacterium]|nr:PA0069 family radical SAM protein [Verrucomicrobiota bacterium]
MKTDGNSFRGRGAAGNLPNRFEKLSLERDPEWHDAESVGPATQFFKDATSSIINYNDSPDVGFDASVNPYRGCEHGCAYCYARPTHEYLGFSAGLDFETKIMVKENAPALLRRELAAPHWKPQVLAMSGVTDCYQPVERRLKITRGCLEVLAEFRNPVGIVTKNHLVTRDVDFLSELARHRAAVVFISVTTLDSSIAEAMEPRASLPAHRLAAIETLARAGVPVGVLVAPVVPGLTDHETPSILAAAGKAGARFAGYVVLRLPWAVRPLFEDWLTRHAPGQKEKVLNRIRALRDGKLNETKFGSRMSGEGLFAEQIAQMFEVARRRAGFGERGPELSIAAFRRPAGAQLELFGER